MLNSGNIIIDKPLTIMGGYSDDFSTRDILKYRSMVQPDPTSNGTAKGGVIFNITQKHKIPVRYIGVGEGINDLQDFIPDKFVEALFNK